MVLNLIIRKASEQCFRQHPFFQVEPTTGIEPVNLILTKDVLYLLSYVGSKGSFSPSLVVRFRDSSFA